MTHWLYIYTASDPLAFKLQGLLGKKGFTVIPSMADVAAVLVLVDKHATKEKILEALAEIIKEEKIIGMSLKPLAYGEVKADKRIPGVKY